MPSPDETRMYRRGGRVAHLVSADSPPMVLCSAGPRMVCADPEDGWYGTGSQDEYERAAGLSLCRKCAALYHRN